MACAGYLGRLFAELDVSSFIERLSCQRTRRECTITTVQNPLIFCHSAHFDEGEVLLAFRLVITIKQRVCLNFHALQKGFLCWINPPTTSLGLGTLADLTRARPEPIAQHALLRQQPITFFRAIIHPCSKQTHPLLL